MATDVQSSVSSMKAVRISNYGGLDALAYENVLQPTPGKREVLIESFPLRSIPLTVPCGQAICRTTFSIPSL